MSQTTTPRRPPYDPELGAALTAMAEFTVRPVVVADLVANRGLVFGPPLDQVLDGLAVEHVEFTVPGYEGAEIVVSVLRGTDGRTGGPGVFHIHGGGMVVGDRFLGLSELAPWVESYGAVVASVEYRLAPEHPDPVPVEDCYAALSWFSAHADELGFDASRVLVIGGSAGGGLSAGTVLLARDRQGPPVAWQVLECPMLDDRNESVSAHQFADDVLLWDRHSNELGWTALLGDRRATDDVSIYAAPGRATDLSGLPPTFLDVGSAEVFRDETVDYAMRLWAAGVAAELHVWAGGFHGFEVVQSAALTQDARRAREAWVARHLGS